MKRFWFCLLFLFVVGCTATTPTLDLPVVDTPTASMAASATLPPEVPPTQTPAPGRVWLVGSLPDGDFQAAVAALAGQSNLTLEVRPDLQTGLEAEVKMVLAGGNPAGLASAVAAAPQVPFVVFGDAPDLPQATNVWRVRLRPQDQLFVAGYLTAILAPDWRSAALLPEDAGLLAKGSEVFTNGARYWCGRCAPTYGPVVLFPLTATLPSGSAPSAWLTAFDVLHEKRVEVVYVAPQAVSEELLRGLAERRVLVVSGGPLPDSAREIWAAAVMEDPAQTLQEIWADVLAGQPGQERLVALRVAEVNQRLLSPGRQERAELVIAALDEGLISPFSVSAP
ncbi:MAG: hypothetical protein LDL12_01985 [Anaerolinea sp.]|nr:hypothetical protein [Anaerolinea sp.]